MKNPVNITDAIDMLQKKLPKDMPLDTIEYQFRRKYLPDDSPGTDLYVIVFFKTAPGETDVVSETFYDYDKCDLASIIQTIVVKARQKFGKKKDNTQIQM